MPSTIIDNIASIFTDSIPTSSASVSTVAITLDVKTPLPLCIFLIIRDQEFDCYTGSNVCPHLKNQTSSIITVSKYWFVNSALFGYPTKSSAWGFPRKSWLGLVNRLTDIKLKSNLWPTTRIPTMLYYMLQYVKFIPFRLNILVLWNQCYFLSEPRYHWHGELNPCSYIYNFSHRLDWASRDVYFNFPNMHPPRIVSKHKPTTISEGNWRSCSSV